MKKEQSFQEMVLGQLDTKLDTQTAESGQTSSLAQHKINYK